MHTTGRWISSFPFYLSQKTSFPVFQRMLFIMDQIQPTIFKNVNAGEMPNSEQLLCGKNFDTIIALGIFEDYLFVDLDSCATNHLLKWCVEVLTAYEFNFFIVQCGFDCGFQLYV